jgi:hypothetical protein
MYAMRTADAYDSSSGRRSDVHIQTFRRSNGLDILQDTNSTLTNTTANKATVTEVSDDNRNCRYADQSVSRNCAKADRTQL